MVHDLDFVGNKVPAFFAVAGDSGASHGKFYSQIQFDGGVDNGIESEDLLFAVGIFGVSSDADSRVGIVRHLGHLKKKESVLAEFRMIISVKTPLLTTRSSPAF